MEGALLQDLQQAVTLDSALLRAEVMTGEPFDQAEILSLAAMSQALFVSATLQSRSLGEIRKCAKLWGEVNKLFIELCNSWAGIDTDEPAIKWLCGRLAHYEELARDRVVLYDISESERLEYAARRGDTSEVSFGVRSSKEEPREWTDTRPVHVYSIGQL